MNRYSNDEKNRLRRLRTDQAINLAMQGKWQEAVELNRQIIVLLPDDAESYNRLGKALAELEYYRDSFEAYSKAVELDPENKIALKNVKRLESLASSNPNPPAADAPTRPNTPIMPSTFIEETGKSGTATLGQLAAPETLSRVIPGDPVSLVIDGNSLKVVARAGEYLGTVEPKMGQHLLRFMQAGNRYVAAVTSSNEKLVKIIIHEVYQDPSMIGRPSFTAQGLPTARPYLRSGAALLEDDEENAYEPDFGEEVEEAEESDSEEVPFEDEDDDLDEEG